MQCSSKLFQLWAKFISKTFPKQLLESALWKEHCVSPFVKHQTLLLAKSQQKNAVPRQIVPSTDNNFNQNIFKVLYESWQKSVKTMLKQIGSSTDKIISKSFSSYLY